MRILVSKFFRSLKKICNLILNRYRKLVLKLQYPGITIDKYSVIEKGCKIICVDGGKLNIIDSHVSMGTYIFVDTGASINIDNCFIGNNCVIASKKSIIIEKGTMISEMVVIRDQDHFIDLNNLHQPFSKYNIEEINIGKYCWLASKCTILKGVKIGDYSVVAGSAVINKEVPAFELWGGIPAKFIKKLK